MKIFDPTLAPNIFHGEKSSMRNRAAKIAILLLIPLSTFATPKEKEIIKLEVVSSKTRIHGSFSKAAFAYTDIIFTTLNGKKVVYECVQRGNICPMVESGKTYTADRDGEFIYISMNSPEIKKAFPVKFKQVGSW